jgi:sugar/nucleoside kinase (ribokinase family)
VAPGASAGGSRQYDILVIGELNVDLILTGDNLVPEFRQVEKLVDDAHLTVGGSAAIFACGGRRLGLTVAFCGKVGDDPFGRLAVKALQERGVDTWPVIVDATQRTGVTVHLSRPTDRAMLTYPGSIAAFGVADVDPQLLGRARHIHLSSYFLQTGLQPGLAQLCAAARAAGATISLDPGWDPTGCWDGELAQTLNRIDVFLPNSQEARHIAGTEDLGGALRALSQLVPLVAVKLGAQGAVARHGHEEARAPGFAVRAVSTIGAGDSFDAGFVYAYLQGRDVATCLRWGCACGALTLTHIGGVAGQPTVDEVEALLGRAGLDR